MYEVRTRNNFPLSPKDGVRDVPKLQYMMWAPSTVKTTTLNRGKNGNPTQAIAFVYENDLYYKPKVQNDLVCRITTTGKYLYGKTNIQMRFVQTWFDRLYWTGKKGLIYNGIPDWFYANTPELKSETIAFSTDGSFLSFLSFNDTNVNEYRYVIIYSPIDRLNNMNILLILQIFISRRC